MNFVVDHVLQSLIVRRSDENLRVEFSSRKSVIENLRAKEDVTFYLVARESIYLVSSHLIAVLAKKLRYFLHVHGVVERRGIANFASIGGYLK